MRPRVAMWQRISSWINGLVYLETMRRAAWKGEKVAAFPYLFGSSVSPSDFTPFTRAHRPLHL